MKDSSQFFSTVSLFVLLNTTSTSLWAMTSETGENDKAQKTVSIKSRSEETTSASQPINEPQQREARRKRSYGQIGRKNLVH